jgi:hypothetical protein
VARGPLWHRDIQAMGYGLVQLITAGTGTKTGSAINKGRRSEGHSIFFDGPRRVFD